VDQSLPKDPEARSLITGMAVALYYGVSAWSQILVWPAVEAPYCEFDLCRLPALCSLQILYNNFMLTVAPRRPVRLAVLSRAVAAGHHRHLRAAVAGCQVPAVSLVQRPWVFIRVFCTIFVS